MNSLRIKIIDESLAEQIVMHRRHQKYWQIRFEESQHKVFVECGRLLANDQKDTQTIIGLEKEFPNRTEAKKYMERCLNTKLKKSYKFLRPKEPPQEIQEPLPLSSILGKRSNVNDQDIIISAGETSKKMHSSRLNLKSHIKPKGSQEAKENCEILIEDEDEEIEEIDGDLFFIGLEGSKKSYKKRTEDDGK